MDDPLVVSLVGTFKTIQSYVNKNWDALMFVVLLYFIYFIYLAISGVSIKFNPDTNTMKKISIVEGITDTLQKDSIEQNVFFCKNPDLDDDKLEEYCNKLTKDNCLVPDCCMYAREKDSEASRCVYGRNKDIGPIIQNEMYDYWYLKDMNTCGGNCPSK